MMDPSCAILQEVCDHLDSTHDDIVKNQVLVKKVEAELALANAKEKDAEACRVAAEPGVSGWDNNVPVQDKGRIFSYKALI